MNELFRWILQGFGFTFLVIVFIGLKLADTKSIIEVLQLISITLISMTLFLASISIKGDK